MEQVLRPRPRRFNRAPERSSRRSGYRSDQHNYSRFLCFSPYTLRPPIMAKKPTAQSPATKTAAPVGAAKPPPPATHKPSGSLSSNPAPLTKSTPQSTLSPRSSPQEILIHVWNKYLQETPSRTMLLDAFMAWLVVVGAVQFLYCVLAGNYVRYRLVMMMTAC